METSVRGADSLAHARILGYSSGTGGGASVAAVFTIGMWRRPLRTMAGFSCVGRQGLETAGDPEPREGRTRVWSSAADHVERYALARSATRNRRTWMESLMLMTWPA
jgi:hypothetical protein